MGCAMFLTVFYTEPQAVPDIEVNGLIVHLNVRWVSQARSQTIRSGRRVSGAAGWNHGGEPSRYGYPRTPALLRHRGRDVSDKRPERIWRLSGRKMRAKQPKRGRLWLDCGRPFGVIRRQARPGSRGLCQPSDDAMPCRCP